MSMLRRRRLRLFRPLAAYTFNIKDAQTGLPIQGAQCSVTKSVGGEGCGCLTNAAGSCSCDPMTAVQEYTVYKAGYETARGVIPGSIINVELGPSAVVMYWVSIQAGTGGQVDWGEGPQVADTFQVEKDTGLTITAIPDANAKFEYWLVDGVNAGSMNPISVIVDHDSFSVNAVFDVTAPPPPPPPPPPPNEWPFIREVHAFDDIRLKTEWHEVSKKKETTVKANTDGLLGGKIHYYIKYETGNDLPVKARIRFNENIIFEDTFSNKESKTGYIDLMGSITENNIIEIWHGSSPALWSEFVFDIWLYLGYNEEPKPPCPFPILFGNIRGGAAPILCRLWKRIQG